MDGPRGFYAKENKSDRVTNTVWCHLNVETENQKKMSKHNKTEAVMDTENKQLVARREGMGGGEK